MELEAILNAVTMVGFPIVMCGGLFWYIVKRDALHKEELTELSRAVNNNTLAITKLLEHLEE